MPEIISLATICMPGEKFQITTLKCTWGCIVFPHFFAGQQLKSLETTVLDFCTSVFPGDVLRITPEIDGGGREGVCDKAGELPSLPGKNPGK